MAQPAPKSSQTDSDGLVGQWLSLEELSQLPLFQSSKRAFKVKLNTNFGAAPNQSEPSIKAAVRREYAAGELICRAGDYGSTAFLLLEGTATSFVPESSTPAVIKGRRRGAVNRLKRLFGRLTEVAEVSDVDVGEISRYASISSDRPPTRIVSAGDLFGVDTCLNFYPREASVRAETRCIVVEMLRSVLDTIREAGEAGPGIDDSYCAAAIRNQLALSPFFRALGEAERETLAAASLLLTSKSESSNDAVFYDRGADADRVYLIRSGSVALADGDRVLTYLGRGAAFGLEGVAALEPAANLQLRCLSHPAQFPVRAVGSGLVLGRSVECDIVFPTEERSIGRKHCRLEARGSEVYLIDLGSANFTLLNGDRCEEALLTVGDRITVVDYTFAVEPAPAETKAVVVQRVATAKGLDSFEVIAIPNQALRQVAAGNVRFAAALATAGRDLRLSFPATPQQAARVGELVELNLYNSQNTLLIDLDRCTRCDQCVRACADAHDGVTRLTRDGPRIGNFLVTVSCRSCTDPQCMVGCPVSSIRRQDSLEIRIEDWCIGCERCANQCPFGNINMVELAASKAPEAAPQLRATVCDLCAGFDGPNCVYACPHEAAIRVNPASFLS